MRELLAHVRTGAGRLVDMLAAPAPPRAEVDAAGYFGAAKFTPEVDAARIDSGRREARRSDARGAGGRLRPGLAGRRRGGRRAPPDRVVRTRHGDAMSLTEFLRTRVVEVGVHGLDLAAALDRPPWLTPRRRRSSPTCSPAGGRSRPELGWDRLTLIRKTTGRVALTDPERAAIDAAGFRWLSFGG